MTAAPVLWAALVVGVLLATVGAFGPVILRQAAPALTRMPRLAVALLTGGILIWPTTLLALSLALAWVLAGPSVFPVGVAEVCEQCLAAANPFTVATVQTAIPSVLLVAVPALAGTVCAAGIAAQYLSRLRRSRSTAATVFEGAHRRTIQGHDVSVVSDDRPWALTFSPGQGGIALSSGAIDRLAEDELAAVLAHEEAHLEQRHHIVTDLVVSMAAQLRWVPFIREAAAALPDYLEIAADHRACRQVSTPALVRALLVLGERTVPAGTSGSAAGPLFAAGPGRIPHLVRPTTGKRGYLPALAAGGQILLLGAVSGVVLLSYAAALLTGCI